MNILIYLKKRNCIKWKLSHPVTMNTHYVGIHLLQIASMTIFPCSYYKFNKDNHDPQSYNNQSCLAFK